MCASLPWWLFPSLPQALQAFKIILDPCKNSSYISGGCLSSYVAVAGETSPLADELVEAWRRQHGRQLLSAAPREAPGPATAPPLRCALERCMAYYQSFMHSVFGSPEFLCPLAMTHPFLVVQCVPFGCTVPCGEELLHAGKSFLTPLSFGRRGHG